MSLATFEWNSSWEYNQRKEQELSEAVNYDIHRLNKVSHMSWDSGLIMCIYFLVPVADVGKNLQLPFYKILDSSGIDYEWRQTEMSFRH